jgi:hypothetical protein
MNATTISRQINSLVPTLKGQYSVKNVDGKTVVTVNDFKIQLQLENALSNFGYMCSDVTNGFEVC